MKPLADLDRSHYHLPGKQTRQTHQMHGVEVSKKQGNAYGKLIEVDLDSCYQVRVFTFTSRMCEYFFSLDILQEPGSRYVIIHYQKREISITEKHLTIS